MITFNNIAACTRYPGTYTEYWNGVARNYVIVTDNHEVAIDGDILTEEDICGFASFQDEHYNYKYVKNGSDNEWIWSDGEIHNEPEQTNLPF